MNWSLSVYPWLHPGLASLYAKMTGHYSPHHRVHINESIICDLSWLLQHICQSSGVFLLQSIAWHLHEADLEVITNASLTGIGMWSLTVMVAFHGPILSPFLESHIIFHKAFVICCAIQWATSLLSQPKKHVQQVVISTDNTNTINIFNSLKAHGVYNDLLKYAVDILLTHEFDLHIVHVPGLSNTVADLLSQQRLDDVHSLMPELHILPLIPPIELVGVMSK